MHEVRGRRQPGHLAEVALLSAGLVTALLAVIPPVGHWAGQYLWVRASQDLLLLFAAPMLIVSGSGWLPTARRMHQAFRRAEASPADGGLQRLASEVPRWPGRWSRTGPVAAVVAFNLCFAGSQVPAVLDTVTGNVPARLAEQALYLGAGLWFWLQIFRPQPGPWEPPLRRVVLVTATTAAWTVLGMVLVFSSNGFYPAYANSLHHVMTVLDDQQLSGGVLWMGSLPFLITAGVILLNAWLNDEDADRPADAQALTRRATRTWAARSGLR